MVPLENLERSELTGIILLASSYSETIDAKEGFNILRDSYNKRASRDDPKAMDKLEHGEKDRSAEADRCAEEATLHYEQVDGR